MQSGTQQPLCGLEVFVSCNGTAHKWRCNTSMYLTNTSQTCWTSVLASLVHFMVPHKRVGRTSLCGGRRTPWGFGTTSTTTSTACRARTNLCMILPSIGTRRARGGLWTLACSSAERTTEVRVCCVSFEHGRGCGRRGHQSHFTLKSWKPFYTQFLK